MFRLTCILLMALLVLPLPAVVAGSPATEGCEFGACGDCDVETVLLASDTANHSDCSDCSRERQNPCSDCSTDCRLPCCTGFILHDGPAGVESVNETEQPAGIQDMVPRLDRAEIFHPPESALHF